VDVGIQRDGGLAEWVAVPGTHAIPLDGFPLELAPLVEPLACCLHAVSLLDVHQGDPAAVVGAGSLGILAMLALRALGARVAVMQRSEARRLLAAELGADAVLGPEDDPAAALGSPPRAVFVSAPGADALTWALERVAPGGRVHAFAGTPGGAPVDANLVHYRHLALVGSIGSTIQDYRRALEMARSGAVSLDLPRETVTLEEVPEMLLDPAPDPRVLKFMVRVWADLGVASGNATTGRLT
jgi:L-iditol 2-dehydrogenase